MAEFMLQEISRRTINAQRYEEPFMTWHNSVITIRTEKGIHFFDFSYDLKCLDKKIDCMESVLLAPKNSSVRNLFSSTFLKSGLRNIELSQLIADPYLWPHNASLLKETTNIKTFEWSPPGVIPGNRCIIAVLNNIGNIEFFGPHKYKWDILFDLSSFILQVVKPEFHSEVTAGCPKTMEQLRGAVYLVQTSAICWAPTICQRNSSHFVSAQKSGDLLFWVVQYIENELKVELVGKIHIITDEIVSLLWIPDINSKFFLICATVSGQVLAINCDIDVKTVTLSSNVLLWKDRDRMISKHLSYKIIDGRFILLLSKHRHLVVLMFDKQCNILSQTVVNVNDHKIVNINKTEIGYYLATVNGNIYKINFSFLNESLDIQLIQIETKISNMSLTHELYGLNFSTNSVLCTVLVMNKRVLHRKYSLKIDLVFLCVKGYKSKEVSLLINNPSKKLTDMWDCIELLRYKTMKHKVLPKSLNYTDLYSNDIYKLKIYLIFLIFYKNLESILKNNSKGLLPEKSVEKVTDKIFLLHAKSCFNDLVTQVQKGEMLSNFENESLVNCKEYIKYYCKKYKKKITNFVESNEVNVIKNSYEYTCQSCDENIKGYTCKNGHLNAFCSVTFTPIETENYLVCKSCGSIAQKELENIFPTCIFCDLYFK